MGPAGIACGGVSAGADLARLRRRVLDWGRGHRRALPWRETRDPWAVLVSEVMLQQTQVSRVVGPWASFVDRFPDPVACARASVADVVRAWEGLGYHRRALGLRRAAAQVVARHGAAVPADLRALRALPGVGDYTARAVLAFAFELPAAVVDTNVARLLARAVAGRALSAPDAQKLADHLLARRRPWEWNQTLLDLGALHCRSRSPVCQSCPLRRRCRWHMAPPGTSDPARSAAGTVRPERPFAGSDRQARGRLLAALRAGPVGEVTLAAAAGIADDPPRAAALAGDLVAEGFASWRGGQLGLQ